MINARESLETLLGSDKLDNLLAQARTKAAAINAKHGGTSTEQAVSELETRTASTVRDAKLAADGIWANHTVRLQEREKKVAYVRHILHVGSKLI